MDIHGLVWPTHLWVSNCFRQLQRKPVSIRQSPSFPGSSPPAPHVTTHLLSVSIDDSTSQTSRKVEGILVFLLRGRTKHAAVHPQNTVLLSHKKARSTDACWTGTSPENITLREKKPDTKGHVQGCPKGLQPGPASGRGDGGWVSPLSPCPACRRHADLGKHLSWKEHYCSHGSYCTVGLNPYQGPPARASCGVFWVEGSREVGGVGGDMGREANDGGLPPPTP